MGINKVILIGNLGADPEIRNLEGGRKVATLRLATNERIRTKEGNWEDHTEWHQLALWQTLAELAEKYLQKGSQIYVEGKLRTRQWEDKEKNKRYTTDILVDKMEFLGGRKGASGADSYPEPNVTSAAVNEDFPQQNEETDDLPF